MQLTYIQVSRWPIQGLVFVLKVIEEEKEEEEEKKKKKKGEKRKVSITKR